MGRRHAIAVAFEPDVSALHRLTEAEAQTAVEGALAGLGFSAPLPGLCAGREDAGAVDAVVAARRMADGLAWSAPCLRAARLLRIEDEGDLAAALC